LDLLYLCEFIAKIWHSLQDVESNERGFIETVLRHTSLLLRSIQRCRQNQIVGRVLFAGQIQKEWVF
jgi:hypothetical protein